MRRTVIVDVHGAPIRINVEQRLRIAGSGEHRQGQLQKDARSAILCGLRRQFPHDEAEGLFNHFATPRRRKREPNNSPFARCNFKDRRRHREITRRREHVCAVCLRPALDIDLKRHGRASSIVDPDGPGAC